MINLNCYDPVEKIQKAWINRIQKILYMKNYPFRKYYCFFQKFDPSDKKYYFYILFSNEQSTSDRYSFKILTTASNKTFKLYISNIYHLFPIFSKEKTIPIDLILEESDENDENLLYRIDFE